jgi:transposase
VTIDVPRALHNHAPLTLDCSHRKQQSGEVDHTGCILRWGDAMLRSALSENAQVLPTQVKSWSALKTWAAQVSAAPGP